MKKIFLCFVSCSILFNVIGFQSSCAMKLSDSETDVSETSDPSFNPLTDKVVATYILSDQDIALAEQKAYEKMMDNLQKKSEASRSEIIYISEYVDYSYSANSGYVDCLGQLEGGMKFPNATCGWTWFDSRDVKGSTSLSISFGGEIFGVSIGLQPGYAIDEMVGGNITIGEEFVNRYCLLRTSRGYKVSRYAVYSQDKYYPESKQFDHYAFVSVPYNVSFAIRAV